MTGPDGAVWVAHPSPLNRDVLGETNHQRGVEDKEELGSYPACEPSSLTLDGQHFRGGEGGCHSSPQSRRLSGTGHQAVQTGSGLENGVGVLGL